MAVWRVVWGRVPRGSKYPMFMDSGLKGMVFGTRTLNFGYLDPLGFLGCGQQSGETCGAIQERAVYWEPWEEFILRRSISLR